VVTCKHTHIQSIYAVILIFVFAVMFSVVFPRLSEKVITLAAEFVRRIAFHSQNSSLLIRLAEVSLCIAIVCRRFLPNEQLPKHDASNARAFLLTFTEK
jgi:hypothetical protein